jgi:UPF0176 protein
MSDSSYHRRAPVSPKQSMQTPETSSPEPAIFHISFYKFVALPDPQAVVDVLLELTQPLLGSILVASEGINGMLAGSAEALDAFERNLAEDARLAAKFVGLHFKRSPCKTVPFGKMKVRLKAEILPLGVPGVDATSQTGIDLSPQEWRELIAQDDVVLIDNRNSFEYRLGHFNKAIDPLVNNFRDFPAYVETHLDEWKSSGKRVAMYCTGGIRCEKTSAWLLDRGLTVYQLEGGILNFFEKMPDAEADWQGECFVFDRRTALDTKLQETDTTVEEVYSEVPSEQWRLARAQRLNRDAELAEMDDAGEPKAP